MKELLELVAVVVETGGPVGAGCHWLAVLNLALLLLKGAGGGALLFE